MMHRGDDLLRLLRQTRLDNSREVLMTELCTVDLLIIDDFARAHDARREPRRHQLLGQGAVDRFKNNAYDLVVDGESYRSRLKPSIDKDGPPPAAPVIKPKPLLRRRKRARA